MKKLHTSWEYFQTKTLKTGDILSYGVGTCAKDIILKAKKLGGILKYILPNHPDYKFGNGGLALRVFSPIKSIK